jgi:hypothetical protein
MPPLVLRVHDHDVILVSYGSSCDRATQESRTNPGCDRGIGLLLLQVRLRLETGSRAGILVPRGTLCLERGQRLLTLL